MTKKTIAPRQELFCREYLVDLNAKQAAIRAGYSVKTAEVQGYQLLQKPLVRSAIAELQEKRAKKIDVTSEYVLRTIVETIERCKQAEPVVDKNGVHVFDVLESGELRPVYKFDARAVLKGAELLGKHLGLFVERREVTGKDGAPLFQETLSAGLRCLSDEELNDFHRLMMKITECEGASR